MIRVYTMDRCPYCEAAKQLLEKRGVNYLERKLKQDDEAQWASLYELSGMKTVPQIFAGEQLVGGFQELVVLDQKDKLSSLKGA